MKADRFLRTFEVLTALADSPEGLNLTELSRAIEAPISSMHNLLQTMVEAELITANDDLRYVVGPAAVRVSIKVVNSIEVRALGRRHLEQLARTLGNDVYLAVRVGDRVVYVERFRGRQPVSVNIEIGDSVALHATAVGKLFATCHDDLRERALSRSHAQLTPATITEPDDLREEFARIREQGYALSREEGALGIFGLAVPVHDATGALTAAIHVSALSAGIDVQRERVLIEGSKQAAVAIEADLGVHRPVTA